MVQFGSGTYFFPKTEYLTSADSGTPSTEIIYENFPGETPVFSGGALIKNWTAIGGGKWSTTLTGSPAYFETLYYNGQRRLRPRVGGLLGIFYRMSTVYVPDGDQTKPENTNCSILTPKGWECFDRFKYNSGDPIFSTWKNLAVPGNANPKCDAANGSAAPIGDIAVLDFEQFSTSQLLVSCVDTTRNVVYLTGPTAAPANNYTETGFIDNHRYLVENVEDSFTQPGQYFLDRSQTPWVLIYFAQSPFENPNFDSVIIPRRELLRQSGQRRICMRGDVGDANPQRADLSVGRLIELDGAANGRESAGYLSVPSVKA